MRDGVVGTIMEWVQRRRRGSYRQIVEDADHTAHDLQVDWRGKERRGGRRGTLMAALLEVKQLTTKVSGFTILNQLDFSVEENELRVLLGPNGAGKTTLIAMVTGRFKPYAGSIHFCGQDITGWPPTVSSRSA